MDLMKSEMDIGCVIVFDVAFWLRMISFMCSDINLNESFRVLLMLRLCRLSIYQCRPVLVHRYTSTPVYHYSAIHVYQYTSIL